LRYCITQQPILSAAIQDAATEVPLFVRPKTLDLCNHLELGPLVEKSRKEAHTILDALTRIHNTPCHYVDGVPAWKLVVMPLEADLEGTSRFWAAFAYSHSHGDGKSGLAFHRSLLRGLELAAQDSASASIQAVSMLFHTEFLPPLLPCLEDLTDLPISWRFLLGPLLGTYLPATLSTFLGLQTGLSGDSRAWIGLPCLYDPDNCRTGVVLLQVDARTMTSVLKSCRLRQAKLTGLLHQAIVYALSQEACPRNPRATFVAATPLNLRNLVAGCGDGDMMNCVSGAYEVLSARPDTRTKHTISEDTWIAARHTSNLLSEKASTLADQPIGLLRYLRNFRPYLLDKLGKARNESYEISNLGNVSTVPDVSVDEKASRWQIERMLFSQPANAIGCAINFNFVSTTAGGLTLTITWQKDVLGLDDEEASMTIVASEIFRFLEVAGHHNRDSLTKAEPDHAMP